MIDVQSTAHGGILHTLPPALGAEPQRDALHAAHFGMFVLLDANAVTLDENFPIVLEDDDQFPISQ